MLAFTILYNFVIIPIRLCFCYGESTLVEMEGGAAYVRRHIVVHQHTAGFLRGTDVLSDIFFFSDLVLRATRFAIEEVPFDERGY